MISYTRCALARRFMIGGGGIAITGLLILSPGLFVLGLLILILGVILS